VLLFALSGMAAAATPMARPASPKAYNGPLTIAINCQIGPCGTTNVFIEPYVSGNDPSWVSGNFALVGSGGIAVNGEIDTSLFFTGLTTEFFPTTYTATWIKDPFPGDFGIHPAKTLSVTMVGIVEVFAPICSGIANCAGATGTPLQPEGTLLGSYSAQVSLTCQNLNGNLVFLNTHVDVWGTSESGTLTDNFAANVACAT